MSVYLFVYIKKLTMFIY